MDHVVRLWNPYVTIKPVAKLDGHTTRVIDVVIHEKMQKLFSYDSDTVRDISVSLQQKPQSRDKNYS